MKRLIIVLALAVMSVAAMAQGVELKSFDQQLFTLQPDGSFKAAGGSDFVLVKVDSASRKLIDGQLFLAYQRNSADEKHCYYNTEYKEEEGGAIAISGTSVDLSKTFFVEAISYTVRFEALDGFVKVYAPSNLSVERFSDFPKYIKWKHYFRKDGSVRPKMQSRYDEINSRLNLVCVALPMGAVKALGK